jgi:hypothetical protein
MGRPETNDKENIMNHPNDIPLFDTFDAFAFDADEVRDLIRTTPLRFDDDGLPCGYEAEQLFGLESAHDE